MCILNSSFAALAGTDSDESVDEIINAVVEAAYTGKIGDGKIWVTPVEVGIRRHLAARKCTRKGEEVRVFLLDEVGELARPLAISPIHRERPELLNIADKDRPPPKRSSTSRS